MYTVSSRAWSYYSDKPNTVFSLQAKSQNAHIIHLSENKIVLGSIYFTGMKDVSCQHLQSSIACSIIHWVSQKRCPKYVEEN